MASKFLHEVQRGASRGSIDMPLALLAGLAVGFVAFVMPGDLLAQAVEMSGLPSVLPAAAPPLGTKAHAVLAVAAAGGTVAIVYLILRMLGGKSVQRPLERDFDEPEPEREAPRLRRSDVHPDAPARRPILATRELGEPTPAPAPTPAPFWRPEDFPPEAEAEEVEPETDVQDEELELGSPGIEMLEPAPVAVVPPEPIAEAPPKPTSIDEANIDDLIARLERGLHRRLQQKSAPEAFEQPSEPAFAANPFAGNDRGDDRLRSAIENLQKMAARAR